LRLFATLRDKVGADPIELDLKDGAHVSDLIQAVAKKYPQIAPALKTSLIAINQQYAFAEDVVNHGDEVALFPPVSGGAGSQHPEYLAVTEKPLDLDELCRLITIPETGAVCVFSGAVRGRSQMEGETKDTSHLVYEAYLPMAESTLQQVALEIRMQYSRVQGIAIVQRIGKLEVGEVTILVACSAAHRNDGCFEAARFGIDRVKEIVPVWKKEVGSRGEIWVEGHYRPTPTDVKRKFQSKVTVNSRANSQQSFCFKCTICGTVYDENFNGFRCQCGGALEFDRMPAFRRDMIETRRHSLWRYETSLVPRGVKPATLGEGWTPLVQVDVPPLSVSLKLESLNPTGSFKDRGASVLTSILKANGVQSVFDDSSGNAGAALAAYAAHSALSATLYVPATASPQKLAQIRAYGAQLIAVDGNRSDAAKAAENASNNSGNVYASHIWNPYSVFAYRTIAYEIWEQLDESAPDAVIMPIGHGSQLLGVEQGFADLLNAGLIIKSPRLFGIQAEACAPLYAQFAGGRQVAAGETQTLAEGIRILEPFRANRVLEAITRSEGAIYTVTEEEIVDGFRQLAQCGVLAEPTSAVVWAGINRAAMELPAGAVAVAVITGSGQKFTGINRILDRYVAS